MTVSAWWTDSSSLSTPIKSGWSGSRRIFLFSPYVGRVPLLQDLPTGRLCYYFDEDGQTAVASRCTPCHSGTGQGEFLSSKYWDRPSVHHGCCAGGPSSSQVHGGWTAVASRCTPSHSDTGQGEFLSSQYWDKPSVHHGCCAGGPSSSQVHGGWTAIDSRRPSSQDGPDQGVLFYSIETDHRYNLALLLEGPHRVKCMAVRQQ